MSEILGIRLAGVPTKGRKLPEVVLFDCMDTAVNSGNYYMLYSCAEHMAQDVRKLNAEDMLEVYNAIVPSVYRWKSTDDISTRIEAAIAIWEKASQRLPVRKAVGGTYGQTEKGEVMAKKKVEEVTKETKKSKKEKSEDNGSTRRGRASEHAGKRLYAKVKPADCGRREGSSRYNSFVIVANTGKTGIKYEDYIEKGGDGKIISWFLSEDKIGVK